MCAHRNPEPFTAGPPIEAGLIWLGGANPRELGEPHERSTHAIAGTVVLLTAVVGWLIAAVAITESADWPVVAIVPATVVVGLLVGAVSRAISSGALRSRAGLSGRAAVAVAVGGLLGELAAVVVFAGPVDRQLDVQAARSADTAPAFVAASAYLDRTRAERSALDDAVERARANREGALVVARCEYNPSPACPSTRITGVPGAGPESRTANEYLADTQSELDAALDARAVRAPALDAQIADEESAVARARAAAIADADRGLGARWVAMNDHTLHDPGALALRLLLVGVFALLSLLPLILKLWRGETTQDRGVAARAERERARLDADTAIAVKRAELRAAADAIWAEQQLASARLGVAAQTEIDRERQRRRVMEALEPAMETEPMPVFEPMTRAKPRHRLEMMDHDLYLPIAAEAEAASWTTMPIPGIAANAGVTTSGEDTAVTEPENLPVQAPSGGAVEPRSQGGLPSIPIIPDVAKTAVRWIRPFVPPILASAIDTTTKPLRVARQVIEDTEEIHFSFKRTRKMVIHTEDNGELPAGPAPAATDTADGPRWVDSSGPWRAEADAALDEAPRDPRPSLASGAEHARELSEPRGRREVRGPQGPRQLPPGQ